jgi:hypothetical protein
LFDLAGLCFLTEKRVAANLRRKQKGGSFMMIRFRATRVLGLGILCWTLSGCGENIFENLADDGSLASKIESAQIALDSRDYDTAISILQGICGTDPANPTCDDENRANLASAYSGQAGLDVINLISNASTGTITSFGSFSTLVPAPTSANKTSMSKAVTLLSGITSRTAAQNLQMAVMAAADIVVTVGVDLTNGFDASTGKPNQVPTLAEVNTAETNSGTVTRVSDDLDLVIQGVNGSGLTNEDLTNDINSIKTGLDTNSSGTVTSGELQTYLAAL